MRRLILPLLLAALFLIPAGASAADEKPVVNPQTSDVAAYAHIELKGSFPEGAQLPGLFGDLTEGLSDAVARIDKAAADAKITGLILHLNDPSVGWSKMRALRQAIGRVQAKGKKVHAYMDGASNMDYLLASACDEIVMPEAGSLMTVGLRSEVSFYKNLFDKLGVKADTLRVGEYKSAAEPYSRTEMSPEFRREMEELLEDFYQQVLSTIAQSRKMPVEKVAAAIDTAPLTAPHALELGLIDRLGYEDELESGLVRQQPGKSIKVTRKYGKKKVDTDFSGLAGMMKMMEMLMGVEQPKKKSLASKIAIIHAQGMIMPGKSQSDPLTGQSTMGSDTMIKAIRTAREDTTVKALVLRIDSPGGSALASDLIWHELERVEQPFVVSMGDVAGSGGYYIAMGADRIFADPGTITGSIGVVGMKFALDGLFQKIGVTTDVVRRGKNSGVLSFTHPFTESERQSMQKMLDTIYVQFTTKAAKGRKMEVAALEKLARGRIYSGSAALKIGLVDELGSLDNAIAWARQAAGVKPEDKLEQLILPKPTSPLEALFGPIDPNADARLSGAQVFAALREISPELAQHWGALRQLVPLAREPALTLMPFRIVVK
jgi:protease IV